MRHAIWYRKPAQESTPLSPYSPASANGCMQVFLLIIDHVLLDIFYMQLFVEGISPWLCPVFVMCYFRYSCLVRTARLITQSYVRSQETTDQVSVYKGTRTISRGILSIKGQFERVICYLRVWWNITTSHYRDTFTNMWNTMLSNGWALQWRHNDRDRVSNHRGLDSLLNLTVCLGTDHKKARKVRVADLCDGNRWIPQAKGPWRGKCSHLMTSSWW